MLFNSPEREWDNMDHTFIKPTSGEDSCTRCKYTEIQHSKTEAVCECCTNVGEVERRYGNMLMCDTCWNKEQAISKEHMSPENQQKRLNEYLERSRKIDEQVKVKTDLFNAATIAAVELKAAIQQDDNIPVAEKDFTYARTCFERFTHFQKVVFEERQALLKNEEAMRMWQVQTRMMAAQLSAELREQFKQADLTYQPVAPKSIKPAATKVGKKFDAEDVRNMAAKYNVPMAAVQMLVVARKITPEEAAKSLVQAGGAS